MKHFTDNTSPLYSFIIISRWKLHPHLSKMPICVSKTLQQATCSIFKQVLRVNPPFFSFSFLFLQFGIRSVHLLWSNRCEFIGANLEESILDGANLRSANLQGNSANINLFFHFLVHAYCSIGVDLCLQFVTLYYVYTTGYATLYFCILDKILYALITLQMHA